MLIQIHSNPDEIEILHFNIWYLSIAQKFGNLDRCVYIIYIKYTLEKSPKIVKNMQDSEMLCIHRIIYLIKVIHRTNKRNVCTSVKKEYIRIYFLIIKKYPNKKKIATYIFIF